MKRYNFSLIYLLESKMSLLILKCFVAASKRSVNLEKGKRNTTLNAKKEIIRFLLAPKR